MKNYYEIAQSDLSDADFNFEHERLNVCVLLYQQAAEKFTKHLLQVLSGNSHDLRSHNIRKILSNVCKILDIVLDDDIDTKAFYLTNFYFDARYPGDNYIEVEPAQAAKCKQFCCDIKEWVDHQLGRVL